MVQRPNPSAVVVQPDPTQKAAAPELPASPHAPESAAPPADPMRSDRLADSRQVLAGAKHRVQRAKAEMDRITAAIAAEELKRSDLKSDLSRAVDVYERAVQEHDTATRDCQAAVKALPVFGSE
jgi:hypothetical protein